MTNKNWSRPFFKKSLIGENHRLDDVKHDRMAEKFLQKKEKECQTSSKK